MERRLAAGRHARWSLQGARSLGRGSSGVTYKAEPLYGAAPHPVAIKALSLRGLRGDWKALELFQREVKTLEALQHPGIPRYLEYFEVDTPYNKGFYLVQALAPGKSLAQAVADGWRCSEEDVKQIAVQILDTLQYLGSRRPPVTHRDVKPDNIVLRMVGPRPCVYLVDFGGVQAAAAVGASGMDTTVVGTYGYMAPEQFRGAASPASDLYGLGGTLLFLLSGRPPSAFQEHKLRLDYGEDLIADPTLAAVVGGLLEPLKEERLSAAAALQLLRAPAAVAAPVADPATPPRAAGRGRKPSGRAALRAAIRERAAAFVQMQAAREALTEADRAREEKRLRTDRGVAEAVERLQRQNRARHTRKALTWVLSWLCISTYAWYNGLLHGRLGVLTIIILANLLSIVEQYAQAAAVGQATKSHAADTNAGVGRQRQAHTAQRL